MVCFTQIGVYPSFRCLKKWMSSEVVVSQKLLKEQRHMENVKSGWLAGFVKVDLVIFIDLKTKNVRRGKRRNRRNSRRNIRSGIKVFTSSRRLAFFSVFVSLQAILSAFAFCYYHKFSEKSVCKRLLELLLSHFRDGRMTRRWTNTWKM